MGGLRTKRSLYSTETCKAKSLLKPTATRLQGVAMWQYHAPKSPREYLRNNGSILVREVCPHHSEQKFRLYTVLIGGSRCHAVNTYWCGTIYNRKKTVDFWARPLSTFSTTVAIASYIPLFAQVKAMSSPCRVNAQSQTLALFGCIV